jgi:spore coat protein U-like protein
MSKKVVRRALMVAAMVGFAPMAWAQGTVTDTLSVTATVIESARIISVGDIAFGNYDPTDPSDTTANGSVVISATDTTAYTVYIGADRTMTSGANNLTYELYSDAGLTSAWGSTLATGESYTSTGIANATRTIYGEIAAGQDVPAGAYTDTVTITVEW